MDLTLEVTNGGTLELTEVSNVIEVSQGAAPTLEIHEPAAGTVVEVYQGLRGPKGDAGDLSDLQWSIIQNKPTTYPPSAHSHDASEITSGIIVPARLGSGTADNTKFLRGDGSWQVVDVSGKVSLTGNETIAGVKTFSSAPVVPDNSFAISKTNGLQSALDSKAGIGHSHTSSAITDFTSAVDARITNWVGAAPGALDTLDELAAALGDDPNFATTVTNQIAGKANAVHTHVISDVTNLQTTLDGKASTSHAHAAGDITSGVFSTARLGTGTANSGTVLYGDGTWKTAPSGGGGSTTLAGLTDVSIASPASAQVLRHDGTNWKNTALVIGDITSLQTTLDAKALIANPSFTGTTFTLTDAQNIVLATGTGTKIGTATSQKIGFFNATPVVQQGATTDLGTALSNLGLRTSGTAYPITTSGAVTLSGAVGLTGNVRMGLATITAATTLTTSSVTHQLADATTAAFNVTLPSTTTAGYRFVIKKIDSGTNAVTVVGTIDGATNFVLSAQHDYVDIVSTTTSGVWRIVGTSRVGAHVHTVSQITDFSTGVNTVLPSSTIGRSVLNATDQASLQNIVGASSGPATNSTTPGATVVVEPSSLRSWRTLTLNANVTVNLSGTLPSSSIWDTAIITFKQPATGGPYTVTFDSGIKWGEGATGPSMPVEANSELVVNFIWTGQAWRATLADRYTP